MMKIKVTNLADLEVLAKRVVGALGERPSPDKATVVALSGDLGAGKTTFVQAVARALKISEVVNSPTFIIFKVYQSESSTFNTLVHMDAYRIDDMSELKPLRFSEILSSPKTLFCIEWAEKIKSALPEEVVSLNFIMTSEGERVVEVEGLLMKEYSAN